MENNHTLSQSSHVSAMAYGLVRKPDGPHITSSSLMFDKRVGDVVPGVLIYLSSDC